MLTGGGGGGGGGAALGDGAALGGDGRGLGDGGIELAGGNGGMAVVMVGSGGAWWSVPLVNVNATPPMAIIETTAEIPKISCGK